MEFEKNIEGLIRAKTFGELTDSERERVLARISEKEYTQFRLVLCGTKNRLNKQMTAPSPRVKENLMIAMREQRKERRPVATFLTKVSETKIPMWQVAAAFAGLLFLAFFGRNQTIITPASEVYGDAQVVLVDTVFETKYDTVYREIPAAKLVGKKVNISPVKVYEERKKTEFSANQFAKKVNESHDNVEDFAGLLSEMPLLADTTLPRRLRELDTDENSLWNKKSVGRSVKDDRDLMRFFSEIN